jgi:hypothetical protein
MSTTIVKNTFINVCTTDPDNPRSIRRVKSAPGALQQSTVPVVEIHVELVDEAEDTDEEIIFPVHKKQRVMSDSAEACRANVVTTSVEKPSGQGACIATMPTATVKNTFINFNTTDLDNPPSVRRVSSAPPEIQPKPLGLAQNTDEERLSPVHKKQRVLNDKTQECNMVAVRTDIEAQNESEFCNTSLQNRGRRSKRSHSRTEARCEGTANAIRTLPENEKILKAHEFVARLKSTDGYRAFQKACEDGVSKALDAPRTPDPRLRLSSKRAWERQMQAYRVFYRQWGTVTVSMEDDGS